MKPIIINGIAGYKKLPGFLKAAYLRATNKCQECKSKTNLQAHRIIRGNAGGLYTVWPLNKKGSNVKMLCSPCHKKVHENEYKHVARNY